MARRLFHALSLGIILFTASSQVLAYSADPTQKMVELVEVLRTIETNYSEAGSVEEEIARLEIYKRFPPEHFEIVRSIEYFLDNRVGGELDVVVINRRTNKVVFIGEVKTYNNTQRAVDKATKQKLRFQTALQEGTITFMAVRHDRSRTFRVEQFRGKWEFHVIGLRGKGSSRYDEVLNITRPQLNTLYEIMRSPKKILAFLSQAKQKSASGMRQLFLPGCAESFFRPTKKRTS